MLVCLSPLSHVTPVVSTSFAPMTVLPFSITHRRRVPLERSVAQLLTGRTHVEYRYEQSRSTPSGYWLRPSRVPQPSAGELESSKGSLYSDTIPSLDNIPLPCLDTWRAPRSVVECLSPGARDRLEIGESLQEYPEVSAAKH